MPTTKVGRRLAAAISIVSLMALIGCASNQPVAVEPTALDIINTRMAKATEAQQELASVAVAQQAIPRRDRVDIFGDQVTLDYVGDIEGVLRRIAIQYSFKFEVMGKRPPEGLMVNIYYPEPKSVVDILKAIAYQYPKTVDVNIGKDTIELIYKRG